MMIDGDVFWRGGLFLNEELLDNDKKVFLV